jgi:hypothetical protein
VGEKFLILREISRKPVNPEKNRKLTWALRVLKSPTPYIKEIEAFGLDFPVT